MAQAAGGVVCVVVTVAGGLDQGIIRNMGLVALGTVETVRVEITDAQ